MGDENPKYPVITDGVVQVEILGNHKIRGVANQIGKKKVSEEVSIFYC